MKIKIGIVETDVIYLDKLVSALNQHYNDKLEICSYTNVNYANENIENQRLDIVMVNAKLPVKEFRNCNTVYLVDDADIDQIDGRKAICKFQRLDLIYKDLLAIYADYSAKATKRKQSRDDASIVTFLSPFGGVGNSTVAAAFAINCALNNKSAIYINLEDFASTDIIFNGEGKYTFTDVVYAVKSKKNNLSMKLESYVMTDQVGAGVDYFNVPVNPMDAHELNEDDLELLFQEIRMMGLYDYIVVDLNYKIDNMTKKLINLSDKLVFVVDNEEKTITKLDKARKLIEVHAQSEKVVEQAYYIINNKTNQAEWKMYEEYNVVARFDKVNDLNFRRVVEQLANNQVFLKLY